MNCPPNSHAAEYAQAWRDYQAELRAPGEMIHLTWPPAQIAVFTIRDQWRRNVAGEIEAWYTRRQISECVAMMQAARSAGHVSTR